MSCASNKLLCDYAAGDAVAGAARGVGLVVVSFGVDHNGGAAIAEQRMGAFAERHFFILELRIGLALGIDGKILHVPGVMAFGIVESVLLCLGIEIPAGGLKSLALDFGLPW